MPVTVTTFSAARIHAREGVMRRGGGRQEQKSCRKVPDPVHMATLPHFHVEKRHPILDRLQRESGQDHSDAENAHAFFRDPIGIPFDVWCDDPGDGSDHADRESGFQSDCDGMLPLLRDDAAEVSGDGVAYRSVGGGEKQESAPAWAPGGLIIGRGPDAHAIGEGLSHRAQHRERDAKAGAGTE